MDPGSMLQVARRCMNFAYNQALGNIRYMDKLPPKKNVHNSLMLYSSLHHTPSVEHDVQEIEGSRSPKASASTASSL
jgi:hypothetical protein